MKRYIITWTREMVVAIGNAYAGRTRAVFSADGTGSQDARFQLAVAFRAMTDADAIFIGTAEAMCIPVDLGFVDAIIDATAGLCPENVLIQAKGRARLHPHLQVRDIVNDYFGGVFTQHEVVGQVLMCLAPEADLEKVFKNLAGDVAHSPKHTKMWRDDLLRALIETDLDAEWHLLSSNGGVKLPEPAIACIKAWREKRKASA